MLKVRFHMDNGDIHEIENITDFQTFRDFANWAAKHNWITAGDIAIKMDAVASFEEIKDVPRR